MTGAIGTFVLHRFCGDEVYSLQDAEILAHDVEGGVALSFEAHAAPEPIRALPDTAPLQAQPHAEVTVTLPAVDPERLVGQHLCVPHGYDDQSEEHIATLYYCEHDDLDENHLDVLSRDGDRFRIHWTGVCTDVNYYDGSKPPARVEIDGEFHFKDMDEWRDPGPGAGM